MNTAPYNLDRLLVQGEGQYFDRKSLWDGPPGGKAPRDRRSVRDDIAEYVAAFANADGGVLTLGMEDDRTLTGHGYPDHVVEDFLAVPQRRLNPPQPSGMRVRHRGHELLIFDVQAAPHAVMVIGNGFPRRCDDSVSRHQATDQLSALVEAGILVRQGDRRGTEYVPGPGWQRWLEDAQFGI